MNLVVGSLVMKLKTFEVKQQSSKRGQPHTRAINRDVTFPAPLPQLGDKHVKNDKNDKGSAEIIAMVGLFRQLPQALARAPQLSRLLVGAPSDRSDSFVAQAARAASNHRCPKGLLLSQVGRLLCRL